ncbi:Uncharacterised protein [Vibrio cholerae]|nr:Uncharacterised protein [Vibrio cholerae]
MWRALFPFWNILFARSVKNVSSTTHRQSPNPTFREWPPNWRLGDCECTSGGSDDQPRFGGMGQCEPIEYSQIHPTAWF